MNISERYKLYTIKKEDTLDSIASFFKIPKDELRDYHNVYCLKGEYISVNLPKNLKHLYVYPNLDIQSNDGLIKVEYDTNNILKITRANNILNYYCEYIIQNDHYNVMMSYDMSVQFIERTDKNQFIYLLNKENFLINKKPPSSFMEDLAHKFGSVLYPMEVLINEKGSFLKIINQEEILKRWFEIKDSLLENYESDFLVDYVQMNESNIKSEKKLNDLIQSDWFLNFYFNQLFEPLSTNFTIEKKTSFPVNAFVRPVQFRIVQTSNKYFDKDEKLPVKLHGYLEDERGILEFENDISKRVFDTESSPYANGDYQIEYVFNKQYQIEKIEGVITLNTKSVKILDAKIILTNN